MYNERAPAYRARFSQRWTVIALNAEDLGEDIFVESGTHFRGGHDGVPLELVPVPLQGAGGPIRSAVREMRAGSAMLQRLTIQVTRTLGEARALRFFRQGDVSAPAASPPSVEAYPVAEEVRLLAEAFEHRLTLVFIPPYDESVAHVATPFEREVLEGCRVSAISCVSAGPSWNDFARTGHTPFGFPNSGWNAGHLNPDGHAAVGRILADELERLMERGLL